MSVKLKYVLFFVGAFYIGCAKAVPITLDANYFLPGTDLSHSINHVTLQQYSHTYGYNTIDYTNTVATNQYSEGQKWNYLSLGDSNDNYTIGLQVGFQLADDPDFSGLSVSSDRAIQSIGFSGVSDNGDPVGIYLFDQNNNFLKEYYVDASNLNTYPVCSGYFSDITQCVTYNGSFDLTHEVSPVYRVWVGEAVYVSAAYINSITVDTAVPEPSGIAALSLGLVVLFLIDRKRRLKLSHKG